jgi:hypothetical protein
MSHSPQAIIWIYQESIQTEEQLPNAHKPAQQTNSFFKRC